MASKATIKAVVGMALFAMVYGTPAIRRQRRQSSDVEGDNQNTNRNDSEASWQEFLSGNSWLLGTGNPADVPDDQATEVDFVKLFPSEDIEPAPISDAGNLDPDFIAGFFSPASNASSSQKIEDTESANEEPCAQTCEVICLQFGHCQLVPRCADYSCPIPETNTFPTKNPVDNSTLRPIEERRCANNSILECLHGVCNDSSCLCDKYWVGLACHLPCTLECVDGTCQIEADAQLSGEPITEKDMYCACFYTSTSKLCQDARPDPVIQAEERGRRLAIILSCCLVLLLILSIILPIVLWRRRVIFVMRVVYFFKPWDNDDGKLYDAYISAGSTNKELRFITKDLVPKLEALGFRLYIPSRDRLAGDVISEDILTAIQQSRRTIMVVTPEYLQNEWSHFELHIAQVETIKLKQRIIPIILEDVSKEVSKMTKSIKHILDSVKCLKIPGYKDGASDSTAKLPKFKKFWKRLELTMPKKRKSISELEIQNNYSSSKASQNGHIYSVTNGLSNSHSSDLKNTFVEVDLYEKKQPNTMVQSLSQEDPPPPSLQKPSTQEIDIKKINNFFDLNTRL